MIDSITLFEKAMLLVVMLSAPALLVAIAVGVIISLLQTVFQIQDQTLPFAVKLVAVTLTLAATGTWVGGEIGNLTQLIFTTIPDVGR